MQGIERREVQAGFIEGQDTAPTSGGQRRFPSHSDPPLSRNLRDSAACGLSPSVRRLPAGFPEVLTPCAVLLPERFRGPVAPSATGLPLFSPALGHADLSYLRGARANRKRVVAVRRGFYGAVDRIE